MIVDKTEGRATNQNTQVEGMGHRKKKSADFFIYCPTVQNMPRYGRKVYESKKKTRRANLAQATPQAEQDTHIDENGVRQPNPPMVNMLKIVNHIGTTSGSQE